MSKARGERHCTVDFPSEEWQERTAPHLGLAPGSLGDGHEVFLEEEHFAGVRNIVQGEPRSSRQFPLEAPPWLLQRGHEAASDSHGCTHAREGCTAVLPLLRHQDQRFCSPFLSSQRNGGLGASQGPSEGAMVLLLLVAHIRGDQGTHCSSGPPFRVVSPMSAASPWSHPP